MNPHHLLMLDLSGPTLSPDERAFFAEYKVGGVCLFRRNFVDRYQAAELSAELRTLLGDDLLVATDQEGGGVVRAQDVPYSPGTMLLGAAADPDLTRNVAAATARGLRAMGVNVDFAPVADVNNSPLNPVIGERSFGSDPGTVARHVVAFVEGLQSEGIAATVKHFPGHGDTATDSHLALPRLNVDLERLHALELVPFKAAIDAGVAGVMSYHGLVSALDPENPATLSKRVITDLLGTELGFKGVTFSDALEMRAIAARYTPAEAVVRALAAGIDMPLYDVHTGPISTHEAILQGIDVALEEGRLNLNDLERSQKRLQSLAKRYPATPDPSAAWREGDEGLLNETAKRAVTVLGDFKPLNPDSSLLLVAPGNVVGGAASDQVETPAEAFAGELEGRGFQMTRAFYEPRKLAADKETILATVRRREVTLFVTTSRTRLEEKEKSFGLEVARAARSFIHVALWNPYHANDLPMPVVLGFGFHPASLRAVAEVLTGARAYGSSPVPLAPEG